MNQIRSAWKKMTPAEQKFVIGLFTGIALGAAAAYIGAASATVNRPVCAMEESTGDLVIKMSKGNVARLRRTSN